MKSQITLLFITLIFATSASAQTFFESVDGDASNDANNPTPIDLVVGSTLVGGTVTMSAGEGGDIDFFTFTIEEGELLTGLFLQDYSPADPGFHGISAGPTGIVPVGPNAGDVTQFLGSQHLGSTTANLLDGLGGNPVAGMGFEGPIGPGTYSYIIQQTGGTLTSYTLDFQVTGPPPASCVIPEGGILADFDGNGTVEFADFLVLSSNFGAEVGTYEEGDINCDGQVAFDDFLVLSSTFGQSAAAAPVPEPSSAFLLLFSLVGMAMRRPR